jgi:HSP20 family protein
LPPNGEGIATAVRAAEHQRKKRARNHYPQALTLKGELKEEGEGEEQHYHSREIQYGPVLRTVRFPVTVESDQATATLKDGLLQVTVPKSQQAKAKPLRIEVP